jgi:group I intron endonuclease
MEFSVYKHTSPTGKVYIGCTSQKPQKRWGSDGCKYRNNTRFWSDIQRYGWDAFDHEVLTEGLTKEEAARIEIELISRHDSTNPTKGYNTGPGGENIGVTFHHSDAARLKISEANKGKHLSRETRDKVSASRKGWCPSDETRTRMSQISKGRPSPNRGKTPTAATREKLTEASKKTPVKNLDTGERFSSIQEAARALKLHAGAIWAVCNGRQKTHGGFRWAYEEVIL